MLKNTNWINDLIGWYGSLLTDHQLDVMKNYYFDDLSLAEIAENNKVSRAAVHNTIKRSEFLLEDFEEKLKVVEKFKARRQQYKKLMQLDNPEVSKIVKELEKIE